MIASFWVFLSGYQLDVRFGSLLGCLQNIFRKITQPFPEKSHECALKLTELWNASLLFDLNHNWLMGASLLALAKSIYYANDIQNMSKIK